MGRPGRNAGLLRQRRPSVSAAHCAPGGSPGRVVAQTVAQTQRLVGAGVEQPLRTVGLQRRRLLASAAPSGYPGRRGGGLRRSHTTAGALLLWVLAGVGLAGETTAGREAQRL